MVLAAVFRSLMRQTTLVQWILSIVTPLQIQHLVLWRDYVEDETNEPIANLTGADFFPGSLFEYLTQM